MIQRLRVWAKRLPRWVKWCAWSLWHLLRWVGTRARALKTLVRPPPPRPRIAFVGTCQVDGMAAAARLMLPDYDVASWHVGVWPRDTPEEILAQLPGFTLIVSQLSDWDSHETLRIGRLRDAGLPVVYLPGLVFTGFHPDLTYITRPGGLVAGPGSDYHSILIAAAFALGVPEHRVPALFNAYVFAELGYLDLFEPAKAALLESFAQADYDIAPLFDRWLRELGGFMYTFNHPAVSTLADLARLALIRGGLLDQAAPAPVLASVADNLADHFQVPIYPPLAQRLGVPGSTTLARSLDRLEDGQARDIALADYVAASYQIYRELDRDLLASGAVALACERLDGVVVR